MAERKVRVRFAPSPTGPLHIGGVRTALYNYLFAHQHGGEMVFRIEDTDSNRFVPGAEEYIIEAFDWLGIKFDEGVTFGGEHGPYRQSERRDIYKTYVNQLLDEGKAYIAFDTPEELEAKRNEIANFQYDARTRMQMRNSLTLAKEEVEKLIEDGEQYVVRFKIEPGTDVHVDDMIRGDVCIKTDILDDKVLYKSADELPTYHLANIVDDHTMDISHVIRGEEWLASMPLHVLLYEAFGWQAPQFAHLPLILKPSGKGKLSKRDGDQGGFPVFPLEWHAPSGEVFSGYREKGYLPQAFINMLALLGWNEGTDREIYTMDELIRAFSLEKVGKSGSRFDPEKARWFNQQYVHALSDEDFFEYVRPVLQAEGFPTDDYARRVCALVKERCSFASDIVEHAGYFFRAPQQYDEGDLKKRWKDGTSAHLLEMAQIIRTTFPQGKQAMHDAVLAYAGGTGLPLGAIMNSLRIALVGRAVGPEIFDIIEVLGVEQTCQRIVWAVETVRR